MNNFLDCLKQVSIIMMGFAVVWGIGLSVFPAGLWSLMMLFLIGLSFFGAIILGAQCEQQRRWDKEELESASKIIKSEDNKIGMTINGEYTIVDMEKYRQKY